MSEKGFLLFMQVVVLIAAFMMHQAGMMTLETFTMGAVVVLIYCVFIVFID